MIDTDLVDDVRTSITTDPDRFSERVDREAERLKDGVREGTFDNSRAIVGLEYEFYGVDRETTALRRVPRWLLRFLAFGEEMGLYNAELNTSPQSLNSYGLTAQQREVQARLAAAREGREPRGSNSSATHPPRVASPRDSSSRHRMVPDVRTHVRRDVSPSRSTVSVR